MYGYAARNAFLPNLSGFAMSLGFVISGAILVEYVFNYPGLGYLLYNAVAEHRLPADAGAVHAVHAWPCWSRVLLCDFAIVPGSTRAPGRRGDADDRAARRPRRRARAPPRPAAARRRPAARRAAATARPWSAWPSSSSSACSPRSRSCSPRCTATATSCAFDPPLPTVQRTLARHDRRSARTSAPSWSTAPASRWSSRSSPGLFATSCPSSSASRPRTSAASPTTCCRCSPTSSWSCRRSR